MKPSIRSLFCCVLFLAASASAQTTPQPTLSKSEALQESIRKGDLAAVKTAIEADPKLAPGNSRSQSPMYTAIQAGKADIVTYLVEKGVDPNAETYGQVPLSMALSGYNETWKPVAEALVAKGAKIDGTDSEGQTPLLRAISYGGSSSQKDKVSWLLSKGANINVRSRYGKSALDTAMSNSSTDIVKLILEKADVKGTDEAGNTPLFAAVLRGNTEYVRLLLDKGADVNAQNAMGDTVLHIASRNPSSMLKMLLDAGAKTDLKNNRGDLPLHIALRRDNPTTTPRIYYAGGSYGGDSDARPPSDETTTPRGTLIAPLTDKSDPNVKDQLGFSPVLLALIARDQESRDLLMERAPKMDTTTKMFDDVAQGNIADLQVMLTQKPFLVYFRLPDGTTPLHVAGLWGSLSAAQLLVQKGADVNARDARGQTPLHEALTRPVGLFARRSKNMTTFLLDKGADVNALDQADSSPLHYATKTGDVELINTLLAKNAKLNMRDKSGQTALFALMTRNSDLSLIKTLLDKGASINVRPQGSASLLSMAVGTRRKELVQLLLDKGADVSAKDSEGRSLLASMIYSGSGDDSAPIAALLLEKGADPNDKIYGDTLISRAVSNGNKDLVKALLSTKKVNLKASPNGQSPLMQAVTSNRLEIAQMLLDAGADPNETDEKNRTLAQIGAERSKEMGDLFTAQAAKTAPATNPAPDPNPAPAPNP